MHGSRGAGPDKAGTEADPAVAELTGLDHAVTIQEHTLVQVVSVKKARAITLEGALQGRRELALKAGRVVVFLRERGRQARIWAASCRPGVVRRCSAMGRWARRTPGLYGQCL